MIFVLVGPTGVGKSSLALKYAKENDALIVNGDAFQCYKEMSIGTAKPSLEERSIVPHYLFDIASIDEGYTIYDYQRDLRKTLDELLKLNKDIIIVGGSGLYLKSALYDFSFSEPTCKVDMSTYQDKSNEELYQILLEIDEESAKNIHVNNRKRVLRAIEIYLESGKAKSKWIEEQQHHLLYDVVMVGLSRKSREELYKLIDDRVLKMIQDGLVEEVENLLKTHSSSLRAFQAIGYKELIDGKNENRPLQESIQIIQKNTRHYAKRQYTYFNHQFNINWFDSQEEAYAFMVMQKGTQDGTSKDTRNHK